MLGHTGPMARETIDVYPPDQRAEVIVTIPPGHDRAGTWHGEIRARLHDPETDDWFFEVTYNTGPASNWIGTFPVEWTRRPDLDDYAGVVPPDVLERMRRDQAERSS